MGTTFIELTIAEMLHDPMVGLIMERDGVTVENLRRLLEDTRIRLEEDRVARTRPRSKEG
jgi:hypothetical protein